MIPNITTPDVIWRDGQAKSFIDKTAIAKQRKGYENALPSSDGEEEEEEDMGSGGLIGSNGGAVVATGDQSIDIENGKLFVFIFRCADLM
jgi:hypothetical protein